MKPTKLAIPPKPRASYDFSRGVRGKYAGRYQAGSIRIVPQCQVAG